VAETQNNLGEAPNDSQPAPGRKRQPRRRLTWLWVLLAFLAGLGLPVLACFGLVVVAGATAGYGGDTSFAFGPSVAVIRVEGIIVPGSSDDVFGEVAGSETITSLIEQAEADENVKAIVLRVDSPGGGVVASDEIHHALAQVEKPIVVSMGTLAASGGYYVSAPADYIFATPHTLTGSIGVISSFINADELLDEVGVDVVVLTTGDFKDTGSLYRDMTDEELIYWQAILDDSYDGFVGIVAEGRGLTDEEVRELADGRVFTGQQALELGLVDEIGYFEDAIAKAADLGGLSGEVNVIELEPLPSFFDYVAAAQSGQGLLPSALDIVELMSQPSLEYRYLGP
jgi:protease-4